MIQQKKVLALITARGGSKGVPGKNIKPLNGKPLIGWTVEAARSSAFVDRVIVSSDSSSILAVASQFGAETPFVRPAEFATDLAKQEDAVLHAMDWVEKNESSYDYLVLLTPTCPLRGAEDIDNVIQALVAHPKAKAVVTVIPCEHSPLHMNTLPEDGSMKDFIRPDLRWKNRQELPTYYQISGAVCVIEWEYFKEQRTILTDLTFSHILPPKKGHDIDTLADFKLAELFLDEESRAAVGGLSK